MSTTRPNHAGAVEPPDERWEILHGPTRPRDPRFCLNHEEIPSVKTCADCGDAFCADCLLEFRPSAPAAGKGRGRALVRCTDGDAACDRDGRAGGQCTVGVALYLASTDVRARWRKSWLSPRAALRPELLAGACP